MEEPGGELYGTGEPFNELSGSYLLNHNIASDGLARISTPTTSNNTFDFANSNITQSNNNWATDTFQQTRHDPYVPGSLDFSNNISGSNAYASIFGGGNFENSGHVISQLQPPAKYTNLDQLTSWSRSQQPFDDSSSITRQTQPSRTTSITSSKPTLPCTYEECVRKKNTFTCQSALRKHMRSHEKPFHCDVRGCKYESRRGFTTHNDVLRHKQTIHRDINQSKVKRYRCILPDCKNPNKEWIRLDNFRSHVVGQHNIAKKSDNLKKILESCQIPSSPQTDADVTVQAPGVDPNLLSNTFDTEETVVPSVPGVVPSIEPVKSVPSVPPFQTQFPQSNLNKTEQQRLQKPQMQLQQVSEQQLQQPQHLQQQQESQSQIQKLSSSLSPLSSLPLSSPSLSLNSSATTLVETNEINDLFGILENLAKDNKSDILTILQTVVRTLALVPTLKSHSTDTQLPNQASQVTNIDKEAVEKPMNSQLDSSSDGIEVCPDPLCDKTFSRKCDMKKHYKRHTKPYGCTFTYCRKTFGSKNDWKRHENDRHFQDEYWKCSEINKDNELGICGKLYPTLDGIRKHLDQNHSILEKKVLDEKAENGHVHRNNQKRFWCGFCCRIINYKPKLRGIEAWNDRFHHIDDHFKRNQDIGDWFDVQQNKKKKDIDWTIKPSPEPYSSVDIEFSHVDMRGEQAEEEEEDGSSLEYIWYCCACRDPNSSRKSDACPVCQHHLCPQCQREDIIDLCEE